MIFSKDSNKLISGGNEGVIVFWNLKNGSKIFLPRMSSPIISIVECSD